MRGMTSVFDRQMWSERRRTKEIGECDSVMNGNRRRTGHQSCPDNNLSLFLKCTQVGFRKLDVFVAEKKHDFQAASVFSLPSRVSLILMSCRTILNWSSVGWKEGVSESSSDLKRNKIPKRTQPANETRRFVSSKFSFLILFCFVFFYFSHSFFFSFEKEQKF